MDPEIFGKEEGKWDILSEVTEGGEYLMLEDPSLDIDSLASSPPHSGQLSPLKADATFAQNLLMTRSVSMPVISEDNISGSIVASTEGGIPKPMSAPDLPQPSSSGGDSKLHVKKSVSFQDFSTLKELPSEIDFGMHQQVLKEENPSDANMDMFETKDFLSEMFSQQNEDPIEGMKRQFKSCPDFSSVSNALNTLSDNTLNEVSKKLMMSATEVGDSNPQEQAGKLKADGTSRLGGPVPIMPAPSLSNIHPCFSVGSNNPRIPRSMTVPTELHLLCSDPPGTGSGTPRQSIISGREVVKESRRHRRLARSREYAKNRREMKKTMKQQLELDAVLLRNALESIQNHKTGQGSFQPLMEVLLLGTKATAQFVSKPECIVYVTKILQHQLAVLEDMERDIKDILMIPWVLGFLKKYRKQNQHPNFYEAERNIDDFLAQSFQSKVKLNHSQISQIQQIIQTLKKDLLRIKALQKVYKCLQTKDWVNTPNSDWAWSALDSVFNEQQRKKLQRWCDTNKESIQQLDLLAKELAYRSAGEQQAMFGFGVC